MFEQRFKNFYIWVNTLAHCVDGVIFDKSEWAFLLLKLVSNNVEVQFCEIRVAGWNLSMMGLRRRRRRRRWSMTVPTVPIIISNLFVQILDSKAPFADCCCLPSPYSIDRSYNYLDRNQLKEEWECVIETERMREAHPSLLPR